jgi:hypothetical protein
MGIQVVPLTMALIGVLIVDKVIPGIDLVLTVREVELHDALVLDWR